MRLQKQPSKLNDMKESDPISLSYLREQNRLNIEALLKDRYRQSVQLLSEKLESERKKEVAEKEMIADGRLFVVGGVKFGMIAVKGGSFMMGATVEQKDEAFEDEYPCHKVLLSDYRISETVVTQSLWKAVMGVNSESRFKGDSYPVDDAQYQDLDLFFSKLNKITGQHFRLPTESEWEYAARGGVASRGCKYSGSNSIDKVGWCYETDNFSHYTHPVCKKLANELGIFDMSGNVSELCSDLYGEYSGDDQINPNNGLLNQNYGVAIAHKNDLPRVLRGGEVCSSATFCRVSSRGSTNGLGILDNIGFRVVLDFGK